MSEGEWRIGREFAVIETIFLDGYKFIPGTIYTAQSFGRIGIPHGRLWAISTTARKQLMDILVWSDAPTKISPVLRRFIEQDPESPFIRAFVRTETGLAPTKDETPVTVEKWFEYIEKAQPPKKRAAPVVTITNADGTVTEVAGTTTTGNMTATYNAVLNNNLRPLTADGLTMSVRVDACQRVSGRACFSRTDYYGGGISVPARILAQDEDEVREWILDNIDDILECEPGDTDWYDEEITDSGSMELSENNIVSVMRDFRRLYPQMARELARTRNETAQMRRDLAGGTT